MKKCLIILIITAIFGAARAQITVDIDTLYVSDIAYEEQPGFLYASFECPGPHAEFFVTLTNTGKETVTLIYNHCRFLYLFEYQGNKYQDSIFHPNYNFQLEARPFEQLTLAPNESFSALFQNDCFIAYFLRDNQNDLSNEMADICPTIRFCLQLPDGTSYSSDKYKNIKIVENRHNNLVKDLFHKEAFLKKLQQK